MTRRFSTSALLASILTLAFLSICLAAPKKAKDKPAYPVPGMPERNEDVAAPLPGAKMILGSFVGPFGSHRITVCLQNVVGQSVNGYSVVAGNERAFSGSLGDNPASFEIHAREPGDHAADGNFVFVYHADTGHLSGIWTPIDSRLQTVTFDLPRRDFRYDPKLGQYPQSSTRLLKTADVENLRPEELRIMRNEIYARHGYTFREKEIRGHFEQQDWYMPVSLNVTTDLTPIEQKNAALIKQYENYGASHYDAFGR